MNIPKKSLKFILTVLFTSFIVCSGCKHDIKEAQPIEKTKADKPLSFTTPLGKNYLISEPSDKLRKLYNEAKRDYEVNSNDKDAIIWFGRRTAYLGLYDDAIAIYTMGIKKYPDEPRLYRHRGHRYISIRRFDEAIADFEKAGQLIQGNENEIEPDGMPNAQNIPVSTLHGNIWYHLGLAYYLKHDYEKAFDAYLKCRQAGSLPDNIVSSTHWLYMIQRRLGNENLANTLLKPINMQMDIIENQSYHDLCKLYKGLIPTDSLLQTDTESPSNDAVSYGLASWYLYNNEKEKSAEIMNEIVGRSSWSTFGYIAAESDLIQYFEK